MKTHIIIILIFLSVCANCTYQKPLVSRKISQKVIVDSLTKETKLKTIYNYWSFKKVTRIGGYYKEITSDSLGSIISVQYSKKNPLNMHDGTVRSYTKIYYYMPSGQIERIEKRIFQHQGRGGRYAVNKTIYFENGKRIKSVNE